MEVEGKSRYEFEGYTLVPNERLLINDGKPVHLKPKVFDTLHTLVRNHGRLLTKEELMQLIWGGRSVEEGNLSQYIFTLRKLFGENPHDHRFIVTIPGEGYRFVARVNRFDENPSDASSLDPSRLTRRVRSLAVLPFRSLKSKATPSFLGLAIADTLITKLCVNRDISIRSTASIIKYTGMEDDPISVGEELGVDTIISGTILESADKFFLNVQLTNISDRETLWANKFQVRSADVLESHDEMATQIADALSIELSRSNAPLTQKVPADQEVYQIFLKGRYFWQQRSEEGLQVGLSCAEQVAAAEPDFALAHVGIADSYSLLGQFLFLAPDEAFPAARSAVEKALQIDRSLAEAYASLAELYFYHEKDWVKAEENYLRACQLNPDYASGRHWFAWFLLAMQRYDEAQVQIEKAQTLDPSSLILSTIRGLPFYYRHDFKRAITQFRYVLDIDPTFSHARYYLGSALVHAGDPTGAIAEFEKMIEAEPLQQAVALLGYSHAVAGDRVSALKQLARLDEAEERRYVSPYVRALIQTGLGHMDDAITLLEKGFEEKIPWMVFLGVDPFLAGLHSEPRFRSLLRNLNLPNVETLTIGHAGVDGL